MEPLRRAAAAAPRPARPMPPAKRGLLKRASRFKRDAAVVLTVPPVPPVLAAAIVTVVNVRLLAIFVIEREIEVINWRGGGRTAEGGAEQMPSGASSLSNSAPPQSLTAVQRDLGIPCRELCNPAKMNINKE